MLGSMVLFLESCRSYAAKPARSVLAGRDRICGHGLSMRSRVEKGRDEG